MSVKCYNFPLSKGKELHGVKEYMVNLQAQTDYRPVAIATKLCCRRGAVLP